MPPTINEAAIAILRSCRKREITQREFLELVSQRTGRSQESVRGTIIGYGKLFDDPDFKIHWAEVRGKDGKPKRLVKRSHLTPGDQECDIEYETPEKQATRDRILSHLKKTTRRVNLITLAAKKGLCAKGMYKKCPNAQIINIERRRDVLDAWEAEGIDTINVHSTFDDFIGSKKFAEHTFEFLNADLMGYVARTRHESLIRLNALKNVKVIALTTLAVENFRSHGRWKRDMKRRYRHSKTPIKDLIIDTMSNYELIDEWTYRRDPEARSRKMIVRVLRLRGE